MKKMFLLPLLCAVLVMFCGGRTAHAFTTVPLVDVTSVDDFMYKVSRIVKRITPPTTLSTLEYSSGSANHVVYAARTSNNVTVYCHVDGDSLLYLYITYDRTNEAARIDAANIGLAAFLASGMTQEELTALMDAGAKERGNSTIFRGYCSATQRTISWHMINDGADSFATIGATVD